MMSNHYLQDGMLSTKKGLAELAEHVKTRST